MAHIEGSAAISTPSTFLEIVTSVRRIVLVVAPSPPPSSVVSVESVQLIMADMEEPAAISIPSTFLEIVTSVTRIVLVMAPSLSLFLVKPLN